MEYNIRLTLPATFMLARIVKITGTKKQIKEFLDKDYTDEVTTVEDIKKRNNEMLLSIVDLFFDLMAHEQAEKPIYELFSKVSGLEVSHFETMELPELKLFFKAFSKVEGLSSFFTQAST